LKQNSKGQPCDLATLAHFPDLGLTFARLGEAMKLRQPQEAMPLTVWIAIAVLAFGSVAYLVGILLLDDILALFSEKK
jgi:hypothetical protein